MVFKIYRAMALLIKVFESQLLTETFRGSAQARPKQALHVTSIGPMHEYCGAVWYYVHQSVYCDGDVKNDQPFAVLLGSVLGCH